jgi:hypothetical protein
LSVGVSGGMVVADVRIPRQRLDVCTKFGVFGATYAR